MLTEERGSFFFERKYATVRAVSKKVLCAHDANSVKLLLYLRLSCELEIEESFALFEKNEKQKDRYKSKKNDRVHEKTHDQRFFSGTAFSREKRERRRQRESLRR